MRAEKQLPEAARGHSKGSSLSITQTQGHKHGDQIKYADHRQQIALHDKKLTLLAVARVLAANISTLQHEE
ncbi:MAG: hypothetical protein R6W74_06170 [Nitrosomonas halophila]